MAPLAQARGLAASGEGIPATRGGSAQKAGLAMARALFLLSARAQLRGARSNRLPSTTLSGSPTYGRVSQAQTLPGMDRENWTIDMGLDVAYEVDLFGRVKRSIEAARGDAAAAAFSALAALACAARATIASACTFARRPRLASSSSAA